MELETLFAQLRPMIGDMFIKTAIVIAERDALAAKVKEQEQCLTSSNKKKKTTPSSS